MSKHSNSTIWLVNVIRLINSIPITRLMSFILGRVLNADPLRYLRFPRLIINRKTLLSNLDKEVTCCVCNNTLIYWSKKRCHVYTRSWSYSMHTKNGKCWRMSRIVKGRLHELPTNCRIWLSKNPTLLPCNVEIVWRAPSVSTASTAVPFGMGRLSKSS